MEKVETKKTPTTQAFTRIAMALAVIRDGVRGLTKSTCSFAAVLG